MDLDAYRSAGTSRWTDLDGPLHYLDFGGPEGAPVIVCVHGLGGSALNWDLLAPHLTDRFRIYAPDLPGHGLTQAERRSTGVHANQHILHRFITEVAGDPVILIGNSMGGMLTILQASSAPRTVSGVVLVSPALPIAEIMLRDLRMGVQFALLSTPGLGSAVVAGWNRLADVERQVARTMRLVAADPSRIPAHAVDAAVRQARIRRGFADTARHLVEAARSVVFISQSPRYARRLQELETPTLLIHGGQDRVVSVTSARAVASQRPEWRLEVLDDVGHVAQMEVPSRTSELILDWLTSNPDVVAAASHPSPLIQGTAHV